MEERYNIHFKLNEIANSNLENSKAEKKLILEEVKKEDTLAVTLRLHLYAEKELDIIIKSIFPNYKSILKQNFNSKLDLVHHLGILDRSIYDAISKLSKVRNSFAHNLDYGKEDDIYQTLKSGLSKDILKEHEIDTRMYELKYVIDNEIKIRLLLTLIWIRLKIVSTNILSKKLLLADRLKSEVIDELSKIIE